jgi:hypothetical protein
MLEAMKHTAGAAHAADARLRKLAEGIAALAGKDELVLEHAREITATRNAAAAEIYAICAEFVAGLNRLLPRAEVMIDPAAASAGTHFQDDSPCLIQINVRGRILQIEYAATAELVSTEEFRIPYTLAGSVRAFNQELLDKDLIEEQLFFFTLEKHRRMWRFFDPRTYRSGPFDQEYLVSLMEQLI